MIPSTSCNVDENDIPIESYFICLADRIDVLLMKFEHDSNKYEKVILDINSRFGEVFAPFLYETFQKVSASSEFWNNINFNSFQDLLFLSLDNNTYDACNSDIEDLAIVFAKIIDYRSPY